MRPPTQLTRIHRINLLYILANTRVPKKPVEEFFDRLFVKRFVSLLALVRTICRTMRVTSLEHPGEDKRNTVDVTF